MDEKKRIKVARENLEIMKGYIDKKNFKKAEECARNANSVLNGTKFSERASEILRAFLANRYMEVHRGANALILYLKKEEN